MEKSHPDYNLTRITRFMSMQGFTVCRAYYADNSTLIISVDDANSLSRRYGVAIEDVNSWDKDNV